LKTNLVLALDFQEEDLINRWINLTEDFFGWYKVGMEAFYSAGDHVIEKLLNKGKHVFLDLKLSDIPNTMYKATNALLARYPVDMINAHLLSGRESVKAFVEAVREASNFHKKPIYAIGVTILTSLSEDDLGFLGIQNLNETVLKLSKLGKESGMDGVVCSLKEARYVKQAIGENFFTVTPGIRFQAEQTRDQKRIGTLEEAISVSDFAIIGRSLTSAESPRLAIQNLREKWEALI
jgi:orotidine-5'-phosphate decarboxylase